MRLIITLLLVLFMHSTQTDFLSSTIPIEQNLKETLRNTNIHNKVGMAQSRHCSLYFPSRHQNSTPPSDKHKKLANSQLNIILGRGQSIKEYNQRFPNGPNQLTILLQHSISKSINLPLKKKYLPQHKQEWPKEISNLCDKNLKKKTSSGLGLMERHGQFKKQLHTSRIQVKLRPLSEKIIVPKTKIDKVELLTLLPKDHHKPIRIHVKIHKKPNEKFPIHSIVLSNNIKENLRFTVKRQINKIKPTDDKNIDLPKSISDKFHVNHILSTAVDKQTRRIDSISSKQRQAAAKTLQVRQALKTIIEQAQWLGSSPVLGEILRAQVATLPEMPKLQKLDIDMVNLRVQRLQFSNQLENLSKENLKQDDGSSLTSAQRKIAESQLRLQEKLLYLLLSGCDTEIIELTKLKVVNTQLIDALDEICDATHRYLFWVPNVNPITPAFFLNVIRDLKHFVSIDVLSQIGSAFIVMLSNQATLLPILATLILVAFNINSKKHYNSFLIRASSQVGKVTQDEFSITLRTLFWSILVAVPLPALLAVIGFELQSEWRYPVAEAMGKGIIATIPILFGCMIIAAFSHTQGLFIAHFHWPPKQVALVMRYYKMSIFLIIPLLITIITLDNLKEHNFSNTLGRLSFILLCLALAIVTHSLKLAGIPLYLDKTDSGDNIINGALWGLLLSAPLLAVLASSSGYLSTAQALLARLETSAAIWFLLLVVYYIIRRWMLIQRRRIAFERAKQRRAETLAQRIKIEEETPNTLNRFESSVDADDTEIDLDAISTQSLQLVRSILTMIALVSVILLWSKIHSAFAFLGNISLWNVTDIVNGIETTHPITLGSILIAILVFSITMQLVRNLPSLLELAVLQHLDLTPGTGYAITTISKYLLLLFGAVLSFSWIGIEWSKLQWVVTALSLGLGFGMQEIFSNFISGLIILFEKPIRIGDTVTIRNLSGSITKINTRATTISDWDRKEIIVPNKAFITEQFINWSLSDTLTRVVLTVPAPICSNSKEITEILANAAKHCSMVLSTPSPEIYLVDIQKGIQIFELRIYASEMAHRMPMRHEIHQLILSGYQQHGITLPYQPYQVRSETISTSANKRQALYTGSTHKKKNEFNNNL